MSDQSSHFKPDFDISEFQRTDFSRDDDSNHKPSKGDSMNPTSDDITEFLMPLQQISLEAVVKSLIEKGILTHKELSDCEFACRGNTDSGESSENARRSPHKENPEPQFVRTHSRREKKHVKYKFLRSVLSRYKWGRRFGTFFFGWKWRRKGSNDGDGIFVG